MGNGLGLQGAYGADAVQQELVRMVEERAKAQLAQQMEAHRQAQVALQSRGLDQGDRRIGIDERQGDARIGIDQQMANLQGDKFGFEKTQWGDLAPQRAAGVANTEAQTWNIKRQPEAEAADRAHDGSMLDRRGAWNLREIGASGAEQRKTLGFGASLKPSAGAGGGVSPYSAERSRRVVQSVDELIGTKQDDGSYVGGMINGWTAGAGSMLKNLPGTDARLVAGKLKTLGSSIAFNELTEMREASKTGGALGAVSERELGLLESSLGAIDQGLDGQDLVNELIKVRDSLTRWHTAKAQMGGATSAQINTGSMGSANTGANLGGGLDVDALLKKYGGG